MILYYQFYTKKHQYSSDKIKYAEYGIANTKNLNPLNIDIHPFTNLCPSREICTNP